MSVNQDPPKPSLRRTRLVPILGILCGTAVMVVSIVLSNVKGEPALFGCLLSVASIIAWMRVNEYED